MCARVRVCVRVCKSREIERGRDWEEEVNISLHSLRTFWKLLPSLVAKHL